jgi:hypothetical protein
VLPRRQCEISFHIEGNEAELTRISLLFSRNAGGQPEKGLIRVGRMVGFPLRLTSCWLR